MVSSTLMRKFLLYPRKLKHLCLGGAKAPGLNDCKRVNIDLILTRLRSFNRASLNRGVSAFWGMFACLLLAFPLFGNDPSYAYKPLRTYKISVPQHAKPLIILDPGHGGTDEGAKIHYFMEKKLTLMTTLLLRKYLNEMGYRVIMTRSKDVFIPLHRRVSIANNTKAVLFVSIHYNSSPSPDAHGIEIFYHSGSDYKRALQSKEVGNLVLKELIGQTHALSRGVKNGNFHVIRETAMPAILVEGGFMTNIIERSNLRDKKYLEQIAKGVALGIDKYLKT